MGRGPRIVLLGDSVLMDSVAEYLAAKHVLGVVRAACSSIVDQFELLKPDLILLELGRPCSTRVIALLQQQPGLAMIGLDLNSSRAIVLDGHQRVIDTMEDLYELVQAVMRRQESWPWGGEQDGTNWNIHS